MYYFAFIFKIKIALFNENEDIPTKYTKIFANYVLFCLYCIL